MMTIDTVVNFRVGVNLLAGVNMQIQILKSYEKLILLVKLLKSSICAQRRVFSALKVCFININNRQAIILIEVLSFYDL